MPHCTSSPRSGSCMYVGVHLCDTDDLATLMLGDGESAQVPACAVRPNAQHLCQRAHLRRGMRAWCR
eukprot:1107818-Alexandrium_andersonii.AAC.1